VIFADRIMLLTIGHMRPCKNPVDYLIWGWGKLPKGVYHSRIHDVTQLKYI